MTQTLLRLFVLFCSLSIISSCAPRGETQSLSDLLRQSRDRYRLAELTIGDSPIKSQLTNLSQKLLEIEGVQNPIELKPATLQLHDQLAALLPHSGYTVRPALAEIVGQYQAIAHGSAVTVDPAVDGSPEIRLLIVRTYSILATELETGRFSL